MLDGPPDRQWPAVGAFGDLVQRHSVVASRALASQYARVRARPRSGPGVSPQNCGLVGAHLLELGAQPADRCMVNPVARDRAEALAGFEPGDGFMLLMVVDGA